MINEEQKSADRNSQSSSQELRSSTVDLQSSRPDAQANVELLVLNAELNNTVSALERANSDLRIASEQDSSERRRAAQHMEMMLGELNHRVKNTLASVQSIAMMTLSNTSSPEAFNATFLARLQALSNAHNLLAREAWAGVELRDLVLCELATFHRAEQVKVTLTCDGLQLTPKIALALSMGMHELTTNAVKYGALSVADGRVTVDCEPRDQDGARWLRVYWQEHGGPDVVTPKHRGFGSRLISEGLEFELGGTVTLSFERPGVVCIIDIPLVEKFP